MKTRSHLMGLCTDTGRAVDGIVSHCDVCTLFFSGRRGEYLDSLLSSTLLLFAVLSRVVWLGVNRTNRAASRSRRRG